ncbi:bifunctional glycosyltransferase family 2/GtrA family protein [Amycolatopsis aidingensis]|uniref:bifunctional glycosyltransferase family 2/GtrA family protein n=1 Tax=Amycolatopsis aidingensis TaxID=2842453 RepID=UPI002FC6D698
MTVDVAIPVFNEERALPGCVAVLHDFLTRWLPFEWVITIVDNASIDGTRLVAKRLARQWSGVRVICLEQQGKGNAVRAAWSDSQAAVVAYMDVDLSTGLDALVPLVSSLAAGHSDIAIGSRLAPGARTVRGAKRELISRGYNALLRLTHGARFRDAQCGFKAARAEVIRPLLHRVEDDTWFFDTELLLLAEHNGLRVFEVPVDWVEDVDSRVHVTGTAATNVRGLVRVARARLSGAADVAGLPPRPELRPTHPDGVPAARDTSRLRHLMLFCVVGLVATVLTLTLYTVFRTWWPPLVANLLAVTLSTLFNTEANRRLTFRDRSRPLALVHAQAFVVFGLYCGFTSGALLVLHAVADRPPRWAELVVLLAASAVGTLGRFVLLTTWVFPARPRLIAQQRKER